jgi:methylated-DNA-[protein]-cysteine S-methyltransferase
MNAALRAAASAAELYWDTMPSTLGPLAIGVDAHGRWVTLRLDGIRGQGPTAGQRAARVREQLAEYFAGSRRDFDLELAPRGTAFQLRVWQALRAIPYGAVRSYGDIARALGQPTATRAIGQANGRNPLPIAIPCHRVIASGGSIGGYTGGLERKHRLLALEGVELALGP